MKQRIVLLTLAVLMIVPGLAFGQASTDFINSATAGGGTNCRLSNVTLNTCPATTDPDPIVAGGTSVNVPTYTQTSAGFPNRRVAPSVQYQRRPGADDYFNATTSAGNEARACSCDTGSILATRAMIDLCRKAAIDSAQYDALANHEAWLDNNADGPPAFECTTSLCCEGITEAGDWTLYINHNDFGGGGGSGSGNCGFKVVKGPSAILYDVQDDPPCKVIGTWAASNAGNTVATDMLREMVFQVDPAGIEGGSRVEGLINITAVPLVGSPASIAPVDTTGKTLEVIQDEIVTKLGLLPMGLEVRKGRALPDAAVHGRALRDSNGRGQADDKSHFRKGGDASDNFPVVHIRNAGNKLLRLEITGQAEQFIGQSTQDVTPAIPTLGEWGMAALTLLLLASGYWLIRRRRAQVGA